jgi:hypothetical protein
MSSAGPGDLPVVKLEGTPCRHLRHNGMLIFTDGTGGETQADCDTTMYWCTQTTKGFGPDDDFVNRDDCRNTSRSCYEPT